MAKGRGNELTGKTNAGTNLTVVPQISATLTQAFWETVAARGDTHVKQYGTAMVGDKDYIAVTIMAAGDAFCVGRVIAASGNVNSPTDVGDFKLTVETVGYFGIGRGAVGAAWTAAQLDGKLMIARADGTLEVPSTDATSGNMTLVGGTQIRPRVAWSWPPTR